MTLLINNDVVDRVLEMDQAVDAVESGFTQLGRGDATYQRRSDIWAPDAANGDFFRWAAQFGAIRDPPRLALRIKSDVLVYEEEDGNLTVNWHNVEPGRFMGFVMLFDTTDGELLAIINDGIVQHYRTAALAGVACKHLARKDADTVGMLGSGEMAHAYAEAFDVVRDLASLTVYSPTEGHREDFARRLREDGIDATAVDDPEAAMHDVDVAAMCTNSRQPIFHHEWLTPGEFVINTSSTEIDSETYALADKVFTGTNEAMFDLTVGPRAERDAGLQRGYEQVERLYSSTDYPLLSEVLVGAHAGRESDEERIVYNNYSAAGVPFSALGALVYRRAREADLGVQIPLEWFQQGIRN